jgi:hypothetical protein
VRNYAGGQAVGPEQLTEPKLTTDGKEVQMVSLLLRVLPPEDLCRFHSQNAVSYTLDSQ